MTIPYRTQELQALAPRLAAGELPPGWEVVASSGYARVIRDGEGLVYYKEFLPRGPLEAVKGRLRGSRASRARRNSDALVAAGFTAPANLAWGRLPGGREYLFTEAVAGEGITHWLRVRLRGRSPPELALRRQLLKELGDFIGSLHAAGFSHGDLRPSNALAALDEGRFRFSLIDNERNRQRLPPRRGPITRNLMQLNMLLPADLTLGDRWRFFLAWRARMPELDDSEARTLALEAYHWAMRRLREKGKL